MTSSSRDEMRSMWDHLCDELTIDSKFPVGRVDPSRPKRAKNRVSKQAPRESGTGNRIHAFGIIIQPPTDSIVYGGTELTSSFSCSIFCSCPCSCSCSPRILVLMQGRYPPPCPSLLPTRPTRALCGSKDARSCPAGYPSPYPSGSG
jgi:hypothetical protein